MYKYLSAGLLAVSLMGAGCMSNSTPDAVPPVTEPTPPATTTTPTPIEPDNATTTPTVPPTSQEAKKDSIVVNSMPDGQKVTSPLTLTGRARGSWYFEASFPIEIRDANDKLIAQGNGQAVGDWMTTNFVPFTAKINFAPKPTTPTGTLVLKKDNPSGEPSRDESLIIPITF